MNQIEILFVSETESFYKTFSFETTIEEIRDSLNLYPDSFDLYHQGVLLEDGEVRDTDLTADNNQVCVVMSDRYKSFIQDQESGVYEGFYDEFYQTFVICES